MTITSNLPVEENVVQIASGIVNLEGILRIPEQARGVILFAHGTGSSRHSDRNRFVAEFLNEARFTTLLFDLLTPEEEAVDQKSGDLRFNITFLAERVITATEWLAQYHNVPELKVGYFGASTGAAAALVAASQFPGVIRAVVSRGGRPDLARDILSEIQTPTLLIVGENDTAVLEINQRVFEQFNCEKTLEILPDATHLFPEPGALERVAQLSRDWFERYL